MYFELYPQPEVHFHCFIAPFHQCNLSITVTRKCHFRALLSANSAHVDFIGKSRLLVASSTVHFIKHTQLYSGMEDTGLELTIPGVNATPVLQPIRMKLFRPYYS